jgi:hypothetical protein
MTVWYRWRRVRARAILALGRGDIRPTIEYEKESQREYALKAIEELQPIGYWNLVVSVILAVGSLVGPILNALVRFLVAVR